MSKSYKTVTRTSTVASAVPDAIAEIEELASEMQEAYDNMTGGGMSDNHPKVELVSNARDALEGKEAPDIPEILEDIPVTYTEQIPKDKRHKIARWARLANACSALQACVEAVAEAPSDNGLEGPAAAHYVEELEEAKSSLTSELEDIISEVEGVEFPTMFG